MLRRAYECVPHYQADIRCGRRASGRLARARRPPAFPFTTKEDLRENYPFGMFAVPMEEIVRIHASSGTTGKPTVVGYTQRDIDTWADLMARSIRAAGGAPERQDPDRLWLWALHRRARLPLRRGAAWRGGDPGRAAA